MPVQFDPFLTYLRTERRFSFHTTEAYRRDLEAFAVFLSRQFGVDQPGSVSRTMVRSWVAFLMEEGYRATTVHRKLSAAGSWFRFLQKEGMISQNPARHIPRPKLPHRLPTFLEERGAEALYRLPGVEGITYPERRDALILRLFYETGMRLSELIGLCDSDVDASSGQVRVTGKRNKTRLVPVSKDMVEEMRILSKFRNEHFSGNQEDAFFVTDRGKKMTRSFVYHRVKKYLSTVTTQRKRSPHVLRHTFATHMLNNGAELNVIKEILGHSSLAATQVYTHLGVEKLRSIHGKAHPRS